jgi:hypothetical protein
MMPVGLSIMMPRIYMTSEPPFEIKVDRTLSRIAMFCLLLFNMAAASAALSVSIEDLPPCPEEGSKPEFCTYSVDDGKRAVIRDGSRKITEYDFYSTFGDAKARLVTDRTGKTYLLLEYAEGRGTNATNYYLSVFLVQPELHEYMRTLIGAPASYNDLWEYKYEVSTPSRGGLRLKFHRTIDINKDNPPEKLDMPFEKDRVIEIGTAR